MNFCGTRIKTTKPEKTSAKKLELLEVKEDMWDCEKEAIKKHNAAAELQNKGVMLSRLKTLDMTFLGKLDENNNIKFGVFSTKNFECELNMSVTKDGKLSSLSCGLPKPIGDGYRKGLSGKKIHTTGRAYRRVVLTANFVGIVPQKIKDKATVLNNAEIPTYLVAEATWKKRNIQTNPDPLLIAIWEGQVYLAGKFDASIDENYVSKEFSKNPETE